MIRHLTREEVIERWSTERRTIAYLNRRELERQKWREEHGLQEIYERAERQTRSRAGSCDNWVNWTGQLSWNVKDEDPRYKVNPSGYPPHNDPYNHGFYT